MISKENVLSLIQHKLTEDSYFLVDLRVSQSNKIEVLIDHLDGMSVDDCVAISRLIEGGLDREKEDFELEVSTPGLSSPLKVFEQYEKNIGRELEIDPKEGKPIKGKLLKADRANNNIVIEVVKKEKLPGTKKKEMVKNEHVFAIPDIARAKVVVSFK